MSETNHEAIDLLLAQHRQIRVALDEVRSSTGSEKNARFADLVRLLAVHETAEEQVVHPAVRRVLDDPELVADRLHEEHEAKYLLNGLYKIGAEHKSFDTEFEVFADKVIAHLELEETEEFGLVLDLVPADVRDRMASAIAFAEFLAPPLDHSGAEVVAEPPLEVFDRLRNGLREWRRQASIA
ncbi:hemerythrin domain-containing protein [Nocardia sp. NPDC052001]|uniref:hemerythrin domain-containing protein n=1 Tax=Nocardia sp. NPDC052001 TaxID=3154853 RepID=UPI003449953A